MIKNSQTIQSFHNALRPLLIYSRTFGLVSFKFTKNGYKKSKIGIIFNVIAFLLFTPLMIYGIILRATSGISSLMITTTDLMLSTGTTIQTVISWLCSSILQDKYMEMLNKIVSTDRKFKELGVWITYNDLHKTIIRRIIIHTLILIGIDAVYYSIFNYALIVDLIIFNTAMLVTHIVNILIVQQAATYVLILKDRYKILNDHLKELQKNVEEKPEIQNIKLTNPLSTKLKMLRIICPLHHELTKIGKIINEVFGLQLLITFGVIFVAITVELYYVCYYIQQPIENKWEKTLGSLFMASNYIISTLILCYACHSTIEEVSKN